MPGIDGYEVCRQLKADPDTKEIPIIFITAKSSDEDVSTGLQMGAHYFLAKPVAPATLVVVVAAVLEERKTYHWLQKEARKTHDSLRLLHKGTFHFRTLNDAQELAVFASQASRNPETCVIGLQEIMVNAVEHGNLGLDYKRKSELVTQNQWEAEIQHRLSLPEYSNRYATLTIQQDEEQITYHVIDQGAGFDWRPFMDFSTERAFDCHGRGIAMANMLGFDRLEYQGNGNEVLAVVQHATNEEG